MSRLSIRTITKEVDKPQGGGGKGTEALYAAEVLLDGQLAVTLRAHSFQKPGQKPGVWPIDALLDYIEACGFPAP